MQVNAYLQLALQPKVIKWPAGLQLAARDPLKAKLLAERALLICSPLWLRHRLENMGAANSTACVAGQRGQIMVAKNRKHDAERARVQVFSWELLVLELDPAVKSYIGYAMIKLQAKIAQDGNNSDDGVTIVGVLGVEWAVQVLPDMCSIWPCYVDVLPASTSKQVRQGRAIST